MPSSTDVLRTRIARLARLCLAVGDADSLTDLLERMVDGAAELLDAQSASFSTVEHEHGLVRTSYNGGRLADGELRRPTDETYALAGYPNLDRLVDGASWSLTLPEALAGAAAAATPQDAAGMEAEAELMQERGSQAAAAVAVVLGDRVWGELYLSRDVLPGFSSDDLLVLELLAAHLSGMRSLMALATSSAVGDGRDALTGLALRQAVDRAVQRATTTPLVVAAFDVDGLKRVNDDYGHAAGDRLLVAAAAALRDCVGVLDGATVVRLGGDEFAAVVEGHDPAVVSAACAAAMVRLSAFLPMAGMSCGIASSSDLRGGVGSGRPLLRLADATLYRAKKAGLSVPLRSWSPARPTSPASADASRGVVPTGLPQDRLERLRGPVDAFCRLVDGAAWWISWVAPGSGHAVVVDRGVRRDRREEDPLHEVGETSQLDDVPWVLRALDAEPFWAGINDVDVDPASQAHLAELGYTGGLTAGHRSASGDRWVVEVFADPLTAPVDHLGPDLAVLLARADPAG